MFQLDAGTDTGFSYLGVLYLFLSNLFSIFNFIFRELLDEASMNI